MRFAVMSDSHDNIWNLREALRIVKSEGVDKIIHCGDFVAPFMLKELNEVGLPVHGVFGNNDGDQFLLTKLSCTRFSNMILHGLIGEIDVGGQIIGFTHQGDVARGLASCGKYHTVCFGHSHEFYQERINHTLLLNPGEIMGKDGAPGFCILDVEKGMDGIKRIELK